MPESYNSDCDTWYNNDQLTICAQGSADAPRTAVVKGDSIGPQWYPAQEGVLVPPPWRLIVLTKSSCPPVGHPFFYARLSRKYIECAISKPRSEVHRPDPAGRGLARLQPYRRLQRC